MKSREEEVLLNTDKQQVAHLLESLNGFCVLPRAGLDLAQTLAANAQRAQLEAERSFGVLLSMDERGIKTLSQLLSSMHKAVKPSRLAKVFGFRISLRSSVLIANTFGALLGEALRRRIGGEWRLIDFENQKLVALWFDERNWALPTYKAGKQFMNGQEDDVLFFYQMLIGKFNEDLKDTLVITQADVDKGQEHLMNLVSRHKETQKGQS